MHPFEFCSSMLADEVQAATNASVRLPSKTDDLSNLFPTPYNLRSGSDSQQSLLDNFIVDQRSF